jgi:hypothetical protein
VFWLRPPCRIRAVGLDLRHHEHAVVLGRRCNVPAAARAKYVKRHGSLRAALWANRESRLASHRARCSIRRAICSPSCVITRTSTWYG